MDSQASYLDSRILRIYSHPIGYKLPLFGGPQGDGIVKKTGKGNGNIRKFREAKGVRFGDPFNPVGFGVLPGELVQVVIAAIKIGKY